PTAPGAPRDAQGAAGIVAIWQQSTVTWDRLRPVIGDHARAPLRAVRGVVRRHHRRLRDAHVRGHQGAQHRGAPEERPPAPGALGGAAGTEGAVGACHAACTGMGAATTAASAAGSSMHRVYGAGIS
ncbi:MAG: hypothetical protein ACKOFI_10455, partial [Phycisphaerales bacterium]